MTNDGIKHKLKERAQFEGFSLMRICRPWSLKEHSQRLREFLNKNRHGEMSWMNQKVEWRSDPSSLWPNAQSCVMLGESYSPKHDPLEILKKPEKGAISVYAQNKDYHDVVKKRLKRLARWLVKEFECEVKVFVDTAPVPEKALGQAAGLGWQGKHTNLVSRDLGSWFFIGSIFTTLNIEEDSMEISNCGTCTSCLDVCPTNAFPKPYKLDARLCISYLTIESSSPIPEHLRPKIGNRIYGCDDCLAVCPWNKFAKEAADNKYHARDDLLEPELGELVILDDLSFRKKFSGSPIKRIGRDRFIRNVLYAIGNSHDKKYLDKIEHLLNDSNPVVADAAQWAKRELNG